MPTKSQDWANAADEVREDIGRAYSFIEGQESLQSFLAYTPEQAIQQFIERLSGSSGLRPNAIERIRQTLGRLESAIEKVRSMPPEAFRRSDPADDVHTPVEPVDDE